MDLEAYMNRYSGETRIQRLLLLVKQPSTTIDVRIQALRLVEQQLKRDGNVPTYKHVFGTGSTGTGTGTGGLWNTILSQQNEDSSSSSSLFSSSMFQYDTHWVEQREIINQQDRSILQQRLSSSQSHLHKEAIRSSYVALAQHDVSTGNIRDGMGYLLRATDYCTNRSQTAQLSLLILELALNLPNYAQVRDYVTKVELTLGGTGTGTTAGAGSSGGGSTGGAGSNAATSTTTTSNHLVATKLKIVSGLERLAQGDFVTAGNLLTSLLMTTTPSSSSNSGGGGGTATPTATTTTTTSSWEWSSVTCPEEIAFYAGLLALATQDRSQIIQLAEHPEALELVPTMKELLIQFSRANYQACCACFIPPPSTTTTTSSTTTAAGARPTVSLEGNSTSSSTGGNTLVLLPFVEGSSGGTTDLYLSKHWVTLCTMIRDRCLMEYLKPYQCIQLDIMAQQFQQSLTCTELQDILIDLVSRGLVPNARIDLRANVLTKKSILPTSGGGGGGLVATSSVTSKATSKALKHKLAKLEHRILDDTYALLIRLACLENEICVQDTTSAASGRRGGSGSGRNRDGSGTASSSMSGRGGGPGGGGYGDDDYHRGGMGGGEGGGHRDVDYDLSSDEEGDTPMLDVSGEVNPEDLY